MNTSQTEAEWEDVESPYEGDYTDRLKVPGGYLYRTYFVDVKGRDRTVTAVAMVFVPA